MLYVRSYRKNSAGEIYKTVSIRCPNIESAQNNALSRMSDNQVVAVVIAKPAGATGYGFHKRLDIFRYERDGDVIRKIPLV
jgi:hypothetical protein